MWATLQGILFATALTVAGISDIHARTIPDSACIVLALAGLIDFSPANLLGLLIAVPLFIASGKGRGGAGDVRLVAAASLTLGLYPGVFGLFIASLYFTLYWLAERSVRMLRKQEKIQPNYPFAPFLSFGFIAAYFIK